MYKPSIYVIVQNYSLPHNLAPQNEIYPYSFTSRAEAENMLKTLYEEDMKLDVFADAQKGEVYSNLGTSEYEISTDDYWSMAEICSTTLK